MKFFFGVVLFSAASLFAQVSSGELLQLPKAIADIKAKAEAGDAEAQFALGEKYYSQLKWDTAASWFRKSAKQGNARAQLALGRILITGVTGVEKNTKEGARWILSAANQGFAEAQIKAGDLYERGLGIPMDKIEAFKWYSLGVRELFSFQVYVDNIALKMSQDEINEAKDRIAKFKPQAPSVAEPELKLQGISGSPDKFLAIVNGRTFAKGETLKITADGEFLTVKCLDINPNSVSVQIQGETRVRILSR